MTFLSDGATANRADGTGIKKAIRNILPANPRVLRFPNPTARTAKIVSHRDRPVRRERHCCDRHERVRCCGILGRQIARASKVGVVAIFGCCFFFLRWAKGG